MVVRDRDVADEVHAADGTTSDDARHADAPPQDLGAGADNIKSKEQDEDGHEEGGDGDADRVCDLQLGLAVEEPGRTVSDEMLRGRMSMSSSVLPENRGKVHTMHQMATPPMVMAEPSKRRLLGRVLA